MDDHFQKLAERLDREDPLSHFRSRFYIPNPDQIYLDGNSLGRLPLKSSDTIAATTHEAWGEELISSWNKGWYDLPLTLGRRLAPLIGANEKEVVVTDNTSFNLYKLADAAIRLQKGRTRIVSDVLNFPTDLYIIQGIIKNRDQGIELKLAGSDDGIYPNIEELIALIDEQTALVVLSLVTFKSGFMYDMAKINQVAQQKGALVIWDLSHATGAVPVQLNQSGTDMAVGCTYKYLNGGPGSPAFLYVRESLIDQLASPVQGWFGELNPFEFRLDYRAADSIRKFQSGTPPIISLSATEAGIELTLEAGINRIREKSIQQSNFLIKMATDLLYPLGFTLGSPSESEQRGSHITFQHPEAYRICKALIHPENGAKSVVPDFREPNNIRFGITPLYTTYLELWQAVRRTCDILENKEFLHYDTQRSTVT